MLDELLKKDKVNTYGLGKGWLIPHAFTHELNEIVVAVIKLEKSMPYPAYDNIPVKFIFLVFYPKTLMSRHLSLLTSLAKILDNETYDRLMSNRVKSGKAILKLLS